MNKKYKCDNCDISFNHYTSLKMHHDLYHKIIVNKASYDADATQIEFLVLMGRMLNYTNDLAKEKIIISLTDIPQWAEIDLNYVQNKFGQISITEINLNNQFDELNKIKESAIFCSELGIKCHAGHGLNYENVKNICKIEQIVELNVGHFIISNSIYIGLEETVKKFMKIINHSTEYI